MQSILHIHHIYRTRDWPCPPTGIARHYLHNGCIFCKNLVKTSCFLDYLSIYLYKYATN